MTLSNHELANLMIEVANSRFGSKSFHRRALLNATEEEMRKRGYWEESDDEWSKSVDLKSKGLANIDHRFSHQLAAPGLIVRERPGYWRLANPIPSLHRDHREPVPDTVEPPPRVSCEISRIIRDTASSRELKRLYDFRCQICGIQIEVNEGCFYIEVHHIKPLGGEHEGLDVFRNMLVLCPNHHAMFDLGIPRFTTAQLVEIDGVKHSLQSKHEVAREVIDYHNKYLCRRSTSSPGE